MFTSIAVLIISTVTLAGLYVSNNSHTNTNKTNTQIEIKHQTTTEHEASSSVEINEDLDGLQATIVARVQAEL